LSIPDNARVWPFAAMDYSIMLHQGSRVDGVTELIRNETWKDGCMNEGPGDMLHFFRRRNTLERLALMRDEADWQSIRYKYHGFICVELVGIPRIADENDLCYDPSEPEGGIQGVHFIGSSQSEYIVVSPKKEVPLKVFELHRNGNELVRCYTNLPHKSPSSDGFTKVEIREDVGDQGSAPCHRNGDGGPMCDFEVTVDEDGYVEWPRANEDDPSKTTIPFLSPPVRPDSLGIIVDRYLRPLRAAMATSPHLSRWNANLSFSAQRCAARWATATINSGRQCPSMVLCTLSCTIHRAMLRTPRLRLGHRSSSPLTSPKRVRWAHRVTGSWG